MKQPSPNKTGKRSEARLYVEGGGTTDEVKSRCREGFRKLLEQCGYGGKMPRIIACGSRAETFDDFKTAHSQKNFAYVAMLVDSEDAVTDIEKPWEHLKLRKEDNWERPPNATDDQVFLMTTCMETWLIADIATLRKHYGDCFSEKALPHGKLEERDRHTVQDALSAATKNCKNRYEKGKRSFALLEIIEATPLEQHLPSFKRMKRILDEKL